MSKIYEAVQTYRNVEPENLIEEVKAKKEAGKRMLQMFASYVDKRFEVIYCFDEGDYNIENIRVVVEKNEVIPSVGEYYPYATPYENEACELFGVKIDVKADGYKHKLYKISAETPYVSPYDEDDE